MTQPLLAFKGMHTETDRDTRERQKDTERIQREEEEERRKCPGMEGRRVSCPWG